jgi:quinol monooxygenase YgiN
MCEVLHAIARMTIPFIKLDEAIEILSSIAQRTRFETGCVSCYVYRDVDSANALMIEEIRKDEKDLVRHLRSDEYQKILLVAEMASAPPEIRSYNILRTTGVETVEEARSANREQYWNDGALLE